MGDALASLMGLEYMTKENLLSTEPCNFEQLHDNPQERFQALLHELVASTFVVQLSHKINPKFMIGYLCSHVMVSTYI